MRTGFRTFIRVKLSDRTLLWDGECGTIDRCMGRIDMSSRRSVAAAMSEHGADRSAEPARAKLVLVSLILVAGVANLNLSVANVALPDIGESFDASQTTLDLIAVGYSLGLAASVLWFGALGDRYGRKLMIVLGHVADDPGVPARRLRAVVTASSSPRASSAGWRRAWPTRPRWR